MLSIWGIAKRANELFQGNEMILFGEIDTTMILQCTREATMFLKNILT